MVNEFWLQNDPYIHNPTKVKSNAINSFQ